MTDIADDTPLTLKEACAIFFRDQVTPKGLRKAMRELNLHIQRVGKADW